MESVAETGMSVYDAIVNIHTLLVLLGTGLFVWIVRQVMPDRIENTKVWRVVLRILPVFVGAFLALVPGLRPMGEVAQCMVVGGVAGTFSSSTYELIRELFGKRIKSFLGSPQFRKRIGKDGGV